MAMTAAALPIGASPGDEAQFVSLINQSRADAGLAALTGYADLTDDARVHTADMIASGQVFHSSAAQLGSYTSGWSLLGENVGMGPNPQLLHQAFLNSPSHRANIMGDYDLVGVGADRSANGVMFVTVVFMKSVAPAPSTTTTTAPPTTTTTTAPPVTTITAPPPAPTPTTTAPAPEPSTTTPPPPTTTTVPVTTTTTLLDSDVDAGTGESSMPQLELVRLDSQTGERPAAKVAGAINERTHVAFRPIFSLLDAAGSDPIVRFTSGGTPVTIE
jgi:hypothetical protein